MRLYFRWAVIKGRTTLIINVSLHEVAKMEKENDNFWFYIAGVIVVAIGLVFMLKSREMESVPTSAFAETKAQVDKQISGARK
jgi:hypothetical protein